MEQNLLGGLRDIGYEGPLLEKPSLDVALQEGAKSVEYTKLVNFLTTELRALLNIDEEVNPISSPEDSVAFIMEVSSFLKELNCPYSALTHGHISDRLQTIPDRLLLLDYLSTELMAARILQEKKPDKKIELKLQETEEAANMRKILMALRFPKPPPNISVQTLFQKLTPTLQATIQKAGPELVGNPAFNGFLSDKQWEILDGVQKDMYADYKIRREMLLTRLDVTVQSFQWSDKTKGKEDLFEKIYAEKRKRLKTEPNVDLSDVIAARDEIAIIEKTSNSSVRKNTRSSLNKVIIGEVPDRGGRTSEHAPPPPEMPSWQQRTPGPSGPRGRGGERGFSRGGRGNFSRGDQSQDSRGNGSGGYRGGFDSASAYGGNNPNYSGNSRPFDSNKSYENQSRNSYSQSRSFDSAGSYGGGASFSNNRGNSYDSSTAGGNYGGRRDSGGYNSYDSAGTYGNETQYEQHSKRAKTYDNFQSNRATYADQYVQEEQHNQQYHRGGGQGNRGGRGRGRSNYHRGGRHDY